MDSIIDLEQGFQITLTNNDENSLLDLKHEHSNLSNKLDTLCTAFRNSVNLS